MEKIIFENVVLNCSLMQQPDLFGNVECLKGFLSHDNDGSFNFTESEPKAQVLRNDKLFAGSELSLVRMRNGRFQFHVRTLPPDFDREEFRTAVIAEIDDALELLNTLFG